MNENQIGKDQLPLLDKALLDKILQESTIQKIKKGTEILRENQYVKILPIVVEGLVKVYSRFEEKELLLYYIEPKQSCVMTFYAALQNTPSKVFASVEEDSNLILLPVDNIPKWLKEHPDLNQLFFHQFNLRYTELLDTIGHLLLDRMDKRLYEHLSKKINLSQEESVKMSHQQIANELGTAREVISRVMKKLETDGKVKQSNEGIQIISEW